MAAEELVAPRYVVAVTALSGEGMDSGDSLFLSALPRLILAELSDLPPRFEGKDYLAEAAMRVASTKLYENGSELYARLDELALRQLEPGIDPQERRTRVAAAAAKALAARSALSLAPSPRAAVGLQESDSLDVVLCDENLRGELLPAVGDYAGSLTKGKKIDLLIHGKAKAVGEYVSVEVFAFDTALARDLASFKVYGDPADPGPLARELAGHLSSYIGGREFARIAVETKPASATVTARGKGLYPRDRVYFAFDEGCLDLEVSAPGFVTTSRRLDYKPGESTVVKVELAPAELGTVRVETLPSGLPVFLDGLPIGLSPLVARLSGSHSIIASSSPDGGAAETVVSSNGPGDLVLTPNLDAKTRAKVIETNRDKFYSALGLFVLSLPIATMAYGLNSMYYDAAYRSQDAGLADLYYVSGAVLAGSAALSGGLAVNAIVRLVRYISSTE